MYLETTHTNRALCYFLFVDWRPCRPAHHSWFKTLLLHLLVLWLLWSRILAIKKSPFVVQLVTTFSLTTQWKCLLLSNRCNKHHGEKVVVVDDTFRVKATWIFSCFVFLGMKIVVVVVVNEVEEKNIGHQKTLELNILLWLFISILSF